MDLTAGIKKLFGLPGETVAADGYAEVPDQATGVTETIRDGANLDRVAAALTGMSSMALEGAGLERWRISRPDLHNTSREATPSFIGRVITENRRLAGRAAKNSLRRAA